MSEQHPEYLKIFNPFKLNPETKTRSEADGWTMDEFRFLADLPWTATEKLDGMNIRLMWDGHGLTFNGKTDSASVPGNLVQHLQQQYCSLESLERFREAFRDEMVTIYGEGFGGSIQKGSKYNPTPLFCAFDIRIGDFWLRQSDVDKLLTRLCIPSVPVLLTDSGDPWTLRTLIDYTRRGFNSAYGPFPAEGVVAKPETELRTRLGERVIVKIKTKDFAPVEQTANELVAA